MALYITCSSIYGISCGPSDNLSEQQRFQACEDTIKSLASNVAKCNVNPKEDYNYFYNIIKTNMVCGSCNNIDNIKDVKGLYQDCIPWLTNLPCQGINFDYPPSCQNQFKKENCN